MNWTSATLGDVVERDGGLIQTGPFGSQLHQSDYVTEGIPVIMPKDIAEGRVDPESVARVSEETALRLSRHQLKPQTIVLPRRGEITKRAFIRDEQTGWLCGTGCLQIALEGKRLLPEFLYYYMEQQEVVRWLEQHAVGTTMLNLSSTIVAELPLKYPAPAVQARISDILATYDSLIENNRRRVTLLEEAARQLYREWFVRRRFPGHEHVEIKDGVPVGWMTSTVGEVCRDFCDGDWIETKDQGGEDYRLLQISNIGQNDFVETDNYRYITEETFRRLRCRQVVVGDILISRMPKPIGRAWLVTEMPWRMVTAVDITIAQPDATSVNPFFYLYHLNSPNHLAHCEARTTGATRPRISRKSMAGLPILLPPINLQNEFGEFASAIHEMKARLSRHIEALQRARDLLLPRLMNGEIAVWAAKGKTSTASH